MRIKLNRTVHRGALLLILLSTLTGCFQNYGRIKRTPEITKSFETYQALPEYRYYYYGTGSMPYAVIGIDRNYELRSRIWQEIDLTQNQLRKYV